jgi:hypothetical protein
MSLHIKITNRGAMEQLGSMFEKRRKPATKQTKGEWKHNDKRKGSHQSGSKRDYSKRKVHIKKYL